MSKEKSLITKNREELLDELLATENTRVHTKQTRLHKNQILRRLTEAEVHIDFEEEYPFGCPA